MLLSEAFVAFGCSGTEQRPQSMPCAAPLQSHFCAMISTAGCLTAAPELGAASHQKSHPQESCRASKLVSFWILNKVACTDSIFFFHGGQTFKH